VIFRDKIKNNSVSFSGDSRPSKKFIELSKDVDVMIHEATFTNDLLQHAQ
jgi:ribonuclease Z